MASLSITASQVLLIGGERKTGTAGATITAGLAVYLDTTTNTWKLAQADGTIAEAGRDGLGIALHGASSGQPIDVAGPGCVVELGAGAAPAASSIYIVGAAAGEIAAAADVSTSTQFRSILALGAGSNRVRVVALAAEAAIP